MIQKITKLISTLNEQLNFADLEIDDPIQRSKSSINMIVNSIDRLKIIFEKEKIKSQEQEIDFFKNIKQKFTSKLIYHNTIYKIETKNWKKRSN